MTKNALKGQCRIPNKSIHRLSSCLTWSRLWVGLEAIPISTEHKTQIYHLQHYDLASYIKSMSAINGTICLCFSHRLRLQVMPDDELRPNRRFLLWFAFTRGAGLENIAKAHHQSLSVSCERIFIRVQSHFHVMSGPTLLSYTELKSLKGRPKTVRPLNFLFFPVL